MSTGSNADPLRHHRLQLRLCEEAAQGLASDAPKLQTPAHDRTGLHDEVSSLALTL